MTKGILYGLTRVVDVDLSGYFDNIRHHKLLEKVARRVQDDDIMHLIKLILKANGWKGGPQGGVISSLLSNIYLNEVDEMMERAREVTRSKGYDNLDFIRSADDMVSTRTLASQRGLVTPESTEATQGRTGQVRGRDESEKTKVVDLKKEGSFSFSGI